MGFKRQTDVSPEDALLDADQRFKRAAARLMPLIDLHGRPSPRLFWIQRFKIRRCITALEQILSQYPDTWGAMWFIGKAYQRLGNDHRALGWYLRAHQINPAHPDIAREGSIAAMQVHRPGDAIELCHVAIQSNPTDAGLHANLALATLFSGDAPRALAIATEALARDRSDAITGRIVRLCREVQEGKRPCPHHVTEVG